MLKTYIVKAAGVDRLDFYRNGKLVFTHIVLNDLSTTLVAEDDCQIIVIPKNQTGNNVDLTIITRAFQN